MVITINGKVYHNVSKTEQHQNVMYIFEQSKVDKLELVWKEILNKE